MNKFHFREHQLRAAARNSRIDALSKIQMESRKEALLSLAVSPAHVDKAKKPLPAFKTFREGFEKLRGQEREDWVLNYVRSGKVPKPNLVTKTVTDPKTGVSINYEVMPDYFSIDGMPVQVNPVTAQKIMAYYGLNLPTNELLRQVYKDADHKLTGKPDMGLLGDDSSKMTKYNDYIAKARAGKKIKPNDVVVGEYKEFTLKHDGDNLHAMGWLKPDGGMFQDYKGSTMHDDKYVDYSTVARGIGNISFKDENGNMVTLSLSQALNNPKYKKYTALISDPNKKYTEYGKTAKDKEISPSPVEHSVPTTQPQSTNTAPTSTVDPAAMVAELGKELGTMPGGKA